MDRRTLERLVDGIDSALGPEAVPTRVEEIAVDMISNLASGQAVSFDQSNSLDNISPEEVIIHVRLSDCSSRLASTVVAHCYDKVRRRTSQISEGFRDFFRKADLNVPKLILHIDGAAELLKGFSSSDIIEIVTTIEQAAIDATFDRVQLLRLRAGKNDSASWLLPHLPDLLSTCSIGEFEVEIGSRETGLRAQDLLDVTRALLRAKVKDDNHPHLTVSCNAATTANPFVRLRGDLRIDLAISLWPHLDRARESLPIGACYTDRYELLGQVGDDLAKQGASVLENLITSVLETKKEDSAGSVFLSLNAPSSGSSPAGIWAGFPVGVDLGSGANKASAILLRNGLLSRMGLSDQVEVVLDGLPVFNSLKNSIGVSPELPPAELAGFLVEQFADAIEAGRSKHLRLSVLETSNGLGISSSIQATGTIERVESKGWADEHFTRGGALIPPLE